MFILEKQETILDVSFQSVFHLAFVWCDLVEGRNPDVGLPNQVVQLPWMTAKQGGGPSPSPNLTLLGFRLLLCSMKALHLLIPNTIPCLV